MEDALDAAAMLVMTGRAVPYPRWAAGREGEGDGAEAEARAWEAAVGWAPPAPSRR